MASEHDEFAYSEDDILYYLVDEEGVEVGFVIEEDGQEVECYYEEFADVAFEPAELAEPAEDVLPAQSSGNEGGTGITREGVAKMTADLNDIAREGAATARELKDTYDEIMDTFGFLMPKGARRR